MPFRIPWADDIALDLGTWQTQVCVRGHGVVVREPTLVAYAPGHRRPIAYGTEARKMLQRGVEGVTIVHPIQGGVVAEFDATVAMLRHFLHQAIGRKLIVSPNVLSAMPAGITSVQRRAVHDALHNSGCGCISLVDTPLASALGTGIGLNTGRSCLVVDMGAGVTDVGVFCEGMVTYATSIRYGGDDLDEATVRAVKRNQGLVINRVIAETIKIEVGTVDVHAMSIAAQSGNSTAVFANGFSSPLDVDTTMVPDVLADAMTPLINELTWILEQLPANQRAEITEEGIVLCGACALLRGIGELFSDSLQAPVTVCTDPMSCTVLGLETILEDVSGLSLGGRRFQPVGRQAR